MGRAWPREQLGKDRKGVGMGRSGGWGRRWERDWKGTRNDSGNHTEKEGGGAGKGAVWSRDGLGRECEWVRRVGMEREGAGRERTGRCGNGKGTRLGTGNGNEKGWEGNGNERGSGSEKATVKLEGRDRKGRGLKGTSTRTGTIYENETEGVEKEWEREAGRKGWEGQNWDGKGGEMNRKGSQVTGRGRTVITGAGSEWKGCRVMGRGGKAVDELQSDARGTGKE